MSIVDKVKEIILKMNEKGIPVPLFRDPDKDGPSISFTFYYLTGFLAIFSLIGKLTKVFGDIDVSGSIYLFLTAAGLYQGRRIMSDGKKIELDAKDKETK
jgi:hypothetical protein